MTTKVNSAVSQLCASWAVRYTLVQYQGMACQADKYVCQHLTKGACTVTTAQQGGVDFSVTRLRAWRCGDVGQQTNRTHETRFGIRIDPKEVVIYDTS